MLKKFFIRIIKSLIIMSIILLIFSSSASDLRNMANGIFSDIFQYADPAVQENVIGTFMDACRSLEQEEDVLGLSQICANRSLLAELKENCKGYRELKKSGIKIKNEEQVRASCEEIESGELELACNQFAKQGALQADLGNIGTLCKDYKDKKISGKDFFLGVINTSFGNQQIELPRIGIIEKYEKIKSYLVNKILILSVLLVLVGLLYLLIREMPLFLMALSRILFTIGILIMLPYFGILAYEKFVGFDTTPILRSFFGGGFTFEPNIFLSLVLLGFLRVYNGFILMISWAFLVVGVAGKVYGFVQRRKLKAKREVKSEKKSVIEKKKF